MRVRDTERRDQEDQAPEGVLRDRDVEHLRLRVAVRDTGGLQPRPARGLGRYTHVLVFPGHGAHRLRGRSTPAHLQVPAQGLPDEQERSDRAGGGRRLGRRGGAGDQAAAGQLPQYGRRRHARGEGIRADQEGLHQNSARAEEEAPDPAVGAAGGDGPRGGARQGAEEQGVLQGAGYQEDGRRRQSQQEDQREGAERPERGEGRAATAGGREHRHRERERDEDLFRAWPLHRHGERRHVRGGSDQGRR